MTGNILFTQTFSLAGHTFFHHLPSMHYERHTQGAVCGFGDYGITVRMFRSLHMVIAHVTGCATALFAVAVRALRIFLNVEGFQRKFFAAASQKEVSGISFCFIIRTFINYNFLLLGCIYRFGMPSLYIQCAVSIDPVCQNYISGRLYLYVRHVTSIQAFSIKILSFYLHL